MDILSETVLLLTQEKGSLEGDWRREMESEKVARQDRFKSGKLPKISGLPLRHK
jgi:hypothetical protein